MNQPTLASGQLWAPRNLPEHRAWTMAVHWENTYGLIDSSLIFTKNKRLNYILPVIPGRKSFWHACSQPFRHFFRHRDILWLPCEPRDAWLKPSEKNDTWVGKKHQQWISLLHISYIYNIIYIIHLYIYIYIIYIIYIYSVLFGMCLCITHNCFGNL